MSIINDLKTVILGKTNLFLIMLCVISYQSVRSEPVELAVLYPESSGSYSKVFKNILDGVNELKNINIKTHRISKKTRPQDIDLWLKQHKVQTVLALGQRSYKISKKLTSKLPFTVGAIVATPNGHGGISMDGNPAIFLQHLNSLAPKVKRVHVVYSEKNTGWLVEIAQTEANKQNIQLIAYKVENLQQGVKYYQNILEKVENNKDAIWIPLDRVVPDKAILPKVLQVAWEKNIVVFSNNPLHAKRGTLFALFPDHKLMGKKLASIAVQQIRANGKYKLFPTSDLKLAVNRKTASHLGLSFSKSKQRQFDIVFPSR